MEKLTKKEEEVLRMFWANGELYVHDLLKLYPEPKPHFNTISTFVRSLQQKGYVSHHVIDFSYKYYAVVSEEDYSKSFLKDVISNYFHNSYKNAISALVQDDKISTDELKELIDMVEKQNK